MNVGDWMYFPNMGAYSSSVASNFNGFGAPKRVYLKSRMDKLFGSEISIP